MQPHSDSSSVSPAQPLPSALPELDARFEAALAQATTAEACEALRIEYLGRKGLITTWFGRLGALPPDERGRVGAELNERKQRYAARLRERRQQVALGRPAGRTLDLTLPGLQPLVGHPHILSQTLERIVAVFVEMGFAIAEGPEVETEWNNFDALNIPPDHPSRDAFDTFYLSAFAERPELYPEVKAKADIAVKPGGRSRIPDRRLLRSHTSPVQVRVMERTRPPLRIVVPGVVFRPDATDASHSFMFHQVEGLMVDAQVSFADLKGVLTHFGRRFFGSSAAIRLRPHYFPFTEPSTEVDVSCLFCQGRGCRVCGRKGWLEIMGAGMVHPNVFRAVGYDARRWQGFAFGMGVERLAMLRHGIDDIRLFFENDVRFLQQF